MSVIKVFIGYVLLINAFCLGDDVLLALTNGQIRGQTFQSSGSGTTFYGFRGIPYATPPVGSLRFKPPLPAQNWDGILDATQDAKGCISLNSIQIPDDESEDCLFLNVYSPNLNTEANLPVMVWIFGGGFNYGTSSYTMYGPDYLIDEGVVFVSLNHRFSALGFLSTGDDVMPGNNGLKDQQLAFKWVRDNIKLFGGDPSKVTVFGESSGAASVAYHIASPTSAGLFRAGILESGTSLGWWSLSTANQKQLALDIAALVDPGVDTSNLTSEELLQLLQAQEPGHINQALVTLYTQGKDIPAPRLEEHSLQNAFVTKSTYQSLENGDFNKVPILIGTQSEEYLGLMGTMDTIIQKAASYDANLETLIPIDLHPAPDADTQYLAQQIKSMYLDSSQLFADNLGAAVRFNSDNEQSKSVIKHADLQSRYTDVYFYQFSYHGLLGQMQNFSIPGTLGSVGHQEELPYLFKMVNPRYNVNTTDLIEFPEIDVLAHQRMVKIWTNFAKYLNPTPDSDSLLQNIVWPTVTPEKFSYVDINENLVVVEGTPRGGTYEIWSNIYDTWSSEPRLTF